MKLSHVVLANIHTGVKAFWYSITEEEEKEILSTKKILSRGKDISNLDTEQMFHLENSELLIKRKNKESSYIRFGKEEDLQCNMMNL